MTKTSMNSRVMIVTCGVLIVGTFGVNSQHSFARYHDDDEPFLTAEILLAVTDNREWAMSSAFIDKNFFAGRPKHPVNWNDDLTHDIFAEGDQRDRPQANYGMFLLCSWLDPRWRVDGAQGITREFLSDLSGLGDLGPVRVNLSGLQ
ncbi:hypothetical protein V8E36_009685 [Tilletia maclaganii]